MIELKFLTKTTAALHCTALHSHLLLVDDAVLGANRDRSQLGTSLDDELHRACLDRTLVQSKRRNPTHAGRDRLRGVIAARSIRLIH